VPAITDEVETIDKMLNERLDAYFASKEGRKTARPPKQTNQRHRPRVICHFCKKEGQIQKDCWNRKGAYFSFGSNNAVMVQGRLNNAKTTMMVDSGAGPCVIDLPTLQKISPGIQVQPANRSLHGIGTAKVIGTAEVDVVLHAQVKAERQSFLIVPELGVVLLGRDFLKRFNSLEISWRCLELKIDGHIIPGSKVINGGKIDSRLLVAQENIGRTDLTDRIDREVDHNDNLSSKTKQSLRALLYQFQDIFIEDPKSPPQTHLVEHVIDTKNAQPTRDKLRRLPPAWREEISKQIEEMLANGICRPSSSPWSSQVLLTKKSRAQCDT